MKFGERIRKAISDLKEGHKKGMINISSAVTLVLALVVVAIVGSVGATVLATQQSSQTANSTAYNISGFGLTALSNFANQLGTVGTVAGLALILTVLIGAVYFLFARGGGGR